MPAVSALVFNPAQVPTLPACRWETVLKDSRSSMCKLQAGHFPPHRVEEKLESPYQISLERQGAVQNTFIKHIYTSAFLLYCSFWERVCAYAMPIADQCICTDMQCKAMTTADTRRTSEWEDIESQRNQNQQEVPVAP